MTIVKNPAGWTFDLVARTMSWPDVFPDQSWPYPEVTLASQVYLGANYQTSQAASRTVADFFKKQWAEAADGRKAKDAPKDCVPPPDSPEYQAALLDARKALWAKNIEGYEVGARDAADPFAAEIDAIGRKWLTAFASAKGWYVLPGKKRLGTDDDAYRDPKGKYATFGAALAGFVASTADSSLFAMKDDAGKPWPVKTRKGTSLADVIAAEAARIVAERKPKVAATVATESDDVEF